MMELPEYPPRLYTSDVLKIARFSQSTLRYRQEKGEFPQPIDRGKQYIYDRNQVFEALGLIEGEGGIAHNDPFKKGLEKLGRTKG